MKLSLAQLVDLARRHGFSDPAFAAAVAMAESAGDTSAVHDTRDQTSLPAGTMPEYSVGLWQINTLSSPGSQYTPQQLTDPDTNAQVAYDISSGGTKWKPGWTTTINTGAYKRWYYPSENVIAPTSRHDVSLALAIAGALTLSFTVGYAAMQSKSKPASLVW